MPPTLITHPSICHILRITDLVYCYFKLTTIKNSNFNLSQEAIYIFWTMRRSAINVCVFSLLSILINKTHTHRGTQSLNFSLTHKSRSFKKKTNSFPRYHSVPISFALNLHVYTNLSAEDVAVILRLHWRNNENVNSC